MDKIITPSPMKVYSQRDVTVFVSTLSVMEARGSLRRCAPVSATRPPDLLVRDAFHRDALEASLCHISRPIIARCAA